MKNNTDPTQHDPQDNPPRHKGSRLATTALALSIPGIVLFPLAIAAIVLAGRARDQIDGAVGHVPGRRAAISATCLGYFGIVVTVMALILPALGHARRSARGMKSTTQVRGILQGLITNASDNNNYCAGLDRNGEPIDLTVEGRFQIMLESNTFSGEYIISPSESKTAWTTGPVTTANYSFAMLDISEDNDRRSEWGQSYNGEAVLLSDRNTGTSTKPSDVMSVHTDTPGSWAGRIGCGDGSAPFVKDVYLTTRYGQSPGYKRDHIFEQTAGDDAAIIYSGD